MPKITLPQKNIILEVVAHSNLMAALRENQIPVASSCLGDGICGKCHVSVTGFIANPDELELQTLQRNNIPAGCRLSCQIAVVDDLTLSTSYW